MTGFGSAEKDGCRVEVRSLNHRFLDVYIKAPPFLGRYEMDFRNLLKKKFSRGKFDVNILISENVNVVMDVNVNLAREIHNAFRMLQKELSVPGEIDINTLTGFREMFMETDQSYDIDAVIQVYSQALEGLYEMRIREGGVLVSELRRMTDALGGMNQEIKARCAKSVFDIKEEFSAKIKLILDGIEIDEGRILQEAVVIAAKSDISEEIVRIESHVGQFREMLENGDVVGRKLDFMLQELNREVNTIASKSVVCDVATLTVDMKNELEKMREQVQNIQ
ncbi:MAG: YicC/YloC family endoribonuclease [Nitrospirota bacterium]|nr:YicC/YloC family endoribonuclease [Nitrospirota bacterium]